MIQRLRSGVRLGVPFLVLLASLSVPVAFAATITVNSTLDVVDDFDGVCTLREALTAANTDSSMGMVGGECVAGSGVDTVQLSAAAYSMMISGTDDGNGGGDFDITAGVLIQGNSPTTTVVDAHQIDRVFHVLNGATATFSNVTITGGNALMNGGGILVHNDSALVLNNVYLQNNAAEKGAALYVEAMGPTVGVATLTNVQATSNVAIMEGGAFYNQGVLNLTNVLVDGNNATTGGGIYSNGDMVIAGSTVSNNTAVQNAGGMQIDAFNPAVNTVTITQSTVANNVSGVNAGGIFHTGGVLTLARSTVSGNVANTTNTINNPPVAGGGIYNIGATFNLFNSTVSGNTITNGNGGGVALTSGGAVNMVNSTVAYNAAVDGGGVYESGVMNFTVQNNIFANNTALGWGPDLFANVMSSGNNLVENTNSAFGLIASDITGVDPSLGSLALNAPGTTQTHALLAGSPALNAGNDPACANPLTINNLDQRGVVRPNGAHCDIGAYDYVTPVGVDVAVLKTDNLSNVSVGQVITYTIKVKNIGGVTPVSNIQVTDNLPVNLANASWTCAITSGVGSCATPGPVSGNINTTVNLNPNAIATFTLTAQVMNTGLTTVINTATVAVPFGYADTNLSNNSSTDWDRIGR